MGKWNDTIVRVYGILHRLFRAPLAPAALRCVLMSYLRTDVVGLHPDDTFLFVNALLPGRFTSTARAVSYLDNLIRSAHAYRTMCLDFLYRFFPGATMLAVLEFWINDFLSAEWDPNRNINITRTRDQYHKQASGILDIAEDHRIARNFMPLYRILIDSDNPYVLLHIGAYNYRLLRMFPSYLEQTRVVKVQMYLAWHYHTRADLDLPFYVLMTSFGDIAGGAVGYGDVEDENILMAPLHNYAFTLLRVTNPPPPRVLLTPAPMAETAEEYATFLSNMESEEGPDAQSAFDVFTIRDFLPPAETADSITDVVWVPNVSIRADISSQSLNTTPNPALVTAATVRSIRAWNAQEKVAFYYGCHDTSLQDKFQSKEEIWTILLRELPVMTETGVNTSASPSGQQEAHPEPQAVNLMDNANDTSMTQPSPTHSTSDAAGLSLSADAPVHDASSTSGNSLTKGPRFQVDDDVRTSQPPVLAQSSTSSAPDTRMETAQEEEYFSASQHAQALHFNHTSPLRARWSQSDLEATARRAAGAAASAPYVADWKTAQGREHPIANREPAVGSAASSAPSVSTLMAQSKPKARGSGSKPAQTKDVSDWANRPATSTHNLERG
jgi:hypothetical protein